MNSNLENNDKILKVFNAVRCLNRDQLPRYLDGRLTDIEKHLVEQHLVDCDLCFDALQTLQQPKYRDQYQPLATNIQQYIRNSIRKVSTTQKVERYQRLEQKKESFLIYFWVVAALGLVAGGIYLVQQQNRLKAVAAPAPIAVVDKVMEPVATRQTMQETASQPIADSPVAVAAPVVVPTSTPTPAPVVAAAKPVVKKDTIKVAAPVAPKPQPPKDSAKKEEKEKEKEDKPAPVVEKKEAPAPAPAPVVKKEKEKEKEKDKDDDNKKTTEQPNGTDEFLYKAAMVYHQQGDLNEAISRYKHLTSSSSKYGELSRYQLAVCYRSKGQTGKARRMFKEVVRMNGSMKEKAQAALDSL
jgi:hypothetical protein